MKERASRIFTRGSFCYKIGENFFFEKFKVKLQLIHLHNQTRVYTLYI